MTGCGVGVAGVFPWEPGFRGSLQTFAANDHERNYETRECDIRLHRKDSLATTGNAYPDILIVWLSTWIN